MKKLLLIGILVIGAYAYEMPLKSEILKMNDQQKDSLYYSHNKNVGLAILLNIIPSLGYVYTGNWIRGFSILGLHFGGHRLIINETRYNENIDTMNYSFSYTMFWIFLSHQDVNYLSEKHNSELYEFIYDKKYPKEPKKSIIQKMIDKIR
jgi:hypothetical protein